MNHLGSLDRRGISASHLSLSLSFRGRALRVPPLRPQSVAASRRRHRRPLGNSAIESPWPAQSWPRARRLARRKNATRFTARRCYSIQLLLRARARKRTTPKQEICVRWARATIASAERKWSASGRGPLTFRLRASRGGQRLPCAA